MTSGASQVQVGTVSLLDASWTTVDQVGSVWPPRVVGVLPGSPAETILATHKTLVTLVGSTASVTPYSGGPLDNSRLRFLPDRDTFFVIGEGALYHCNLSPAASCVPTGQLGVAAGERITDFWVHDADPSRVVARASDMFDAGSLYASTDGGAHFDAIALPPSPTRLRAVAVSPVDPAIIAVGFDVGTMTPATFFTTSDAGVSWTALALPAPSSGTDVVFDATGRIFVLASGALYSKAP